MRKVIVFTLLAMLYAGYGLALTEKDFQALLKSSHQFREADKILNDTWKDVSSGLDKKDKAFLLKRQREWVKEGRDESAREYINMGYSRPCAYAIATRKWAKTLQVFQYNAALSEEEAGRAKDDDAFWDDENDIPLECQAE